MSKEEMGNGAHTTSRKEDRSEEDIFNDTMMDLISQNLRDTQALRREVQTMRSENVLIFSKGSLSNTDTNRDTSA